MSRYKFKYKCDDFDVPVRCSAKGNDIFYYEAGLLNLRDAIDEELERIGSNGKWSFI